MKWTNEFKNKETWQESLRSVTNLKLLHWHLIVLVHRKLPWAYITNDFTAVLKRWKSDHIRWWMHKVTSILIANLPKAIKIKTRWQVMVGGIEKQDSSCRKNDDDDYDETYSASNWLADFDDTSSGPKVLKNVSLWNLMAEGQTALQKHAWIHTCRNIIESTKTAMKDWWFFFVFFRVSSLFSLLLNKPAY